MMARRLRVRGLAWSGALLLAVAQAMPAHAEPARRIVSLNVCIDQILIDLVGRERIAAVTHLAADPLTSPKPERAVGLPVTRGAAEDVLARDPDLILAGFYTTPATVDLLRRLGRRVEAFGLPETFADVRDLIRRIALATGDRGQGEALIAAFDARLSAAMAQVPRDAARPTALIYQVNNYVSTGGLIDAALAMAGFANGAERLNLARSGRVGVEGVVMNPPDLLVLASSPETYRTAVADNLRHPALARIAAGRPTLVLPWPLWLCGTHHMAAAVEQLVAARIGVAGVRP